MIFTKSITLIFATCCTERAKRARTHISAGFGFDGDFEALGGGKNVGKGWLLHRVACKNTKLLVFYRVG